MPKTSDFVDSSSSTPTDATNVPFVPVGTIVAATVQDALEELEADIVSMNDMPDLTIWLQNQLL
jgi:hypothetical protein